MRPTDALPQPEDWNTTTVERSVDLKRGVSWSKEQEHAKPGAGRVPVIGIGNVQRTLELEDLLYLSGLKPAVVEKKRVTAGWTVLVGSNGNRARVGNAAIVREDADFLFASFLLGARPKSNSGLSPEFFYRWLSSAQVQGYLSASSEGTTGLNNLSHSFFRAMAIPVPPPAEQAGIVRILDAVDTALERTRAAVDRARQVKRAVLQRFFYEALGETAYADRPRRKLPAGWSLIATGRLLSEDPKNGVSPEASSQPPGTPTFSIAAI
jgi:type I restriction enzyme S subunit